ncbi:MAG: alcohol dehydrogenase, partial [Thermoprotei archaeon]
GQGYDYVVEVTGNPKGLSLALKLVRPRGVIAAKSTHGAPVSFNYTEMVVKEVKIVSSRCGPFPPAIKLLEKNIVKVSELITSIYPLRRVKEAFEKSLKRDQVKVIVKP